MAEDENLFTEHGKASQLPQYDDITIRNIELISLNSDLRNQLVFGANNSSLFLALQKFHYHFGGIYDATFLETKESLTKKDSERIINFLKSPVVDVLSPDMEDDENRDIMVTSVTNALEIFSIYQEALKEVGFRKITYHTLKSDYAARRSL